MALRWRDVVLVGILFHTVYLFSIFDVYFTSTIVTTPIPLTPVPAFEKGANRRLASRLVVVVADGLRADTIFSPNKGQPRVLAPFIGEVIARRGAWGVSHTRVPTESRPGHVAILAGLPEDVAAVTKGWKVNPVAFDSTLNRSQTSWAIGSPDLVNIFQHPSVFSASYSEQEEDFASRDPRQLDKWVFDYVDSLLAQAKEARRKIDLGTATPADKRLLSRIMAPGSVWFLHLLGLDTNGHAHGPHSEDYKTNLKFVDSGIQHLEQSFESFFGDRNTCFLLTSDHGMHSRGNHGDGDPQNTLTPFVLWGSGARGPIEAPGTVIGPTRGSANQQDWAAWAADRDSTIAHPDEWLFHKFLRRDVYQINLAPLISIIVGNSIPVHSVGTLPVDLLDADDDFKQRALRANALQICRIYEIKEAARRAREPFYSPFRPLAHFARNPLTSSANAIVDFFGINHDAAIDICLEGIDYLQKYDWLFLRTIVSLGYVGWMVYLLQSIIVPAPTTPINYSGVQRLVDCLTLLGSSGLILYLFVKGAPFQYYLYCGFPIFFWHRIVRQSLRSNILWFNLTFHTVLLISVSMGILILLAISFHIRYLLTIICIIISLWPPSYTDRWRKWRWFGSFALISIFPSLPPADGSESLPLVILGVIVMVPLLGLLDNRRIAVRLGFFMLIAAINVCIVSFSLFHKRGLPIPCQFVSWALLLWSPREAWHVARLPQAPESRIVAIGLAIAPAYILLSISYELLFYAFFIYVCSAWAMAMHEDHSTNIFISAWDVRQTLVFLFLINIAFFGTGNIASVASFSLKSVYRFLTIFAPFTMAGLLILKVLLPYMTLAAAFHTVSCARMVTLPGHQRTHKALRQPSMVLFLLSAAASDVLTLYFFWQISDNGSWLEIGTSISHFTISSFLLVFIFVLHGLCFVIMPQTEVKKTY